MVRPITRLFVILLFHSSLCSLFRVTNVIKDDKSLLGCVSWDITNSQLCVKCEHSFNLIHGECLPIIHSSLKSRRITAQYEDEQLGDGNGIIPIIIFYVCFLFLMVLMWVHYMKRNNKKNDFREKIAYEAPDFLEKKGDYTEEEEKDQALIIKEPDTYIPNVPYRSYYRSRRVKVKAPNTLSTRTPAVRGFTSNHATNYNTNRGKVKTSTSSNLPGNSFSNRNHKTIDFKGEKPPAIIPPSSISSYKRREMDLLAKRLEQNERYQSLSYAERSRREKEERNYVRQFGTGDRYIPPAVRRKMQQDAMKKSSSNSNASRSNNNRSGGGGGRGYSRPSGGGGGGRSSSGGGRNVRSTSSNNRSSRGSGVRQTSFNNRPSRSSNIRSGSRRRGF